MVEGASVWDIRVHELVQVFFDESMQVVAVFLQVGLLLLEKLFFNLVELSVVVKAECIRPHQDFSACDHCMQAFFEELELLGRVLL